MDEGAVAKAKLGQVGEQLAKLEITRAKFEGLLHDLHISLGPVLRETEPAPEATKMEKADLVGTAGLIRDIEEYLGRDAAFLTSMIDRLEL